MTYIHGHHQQKGLVKRFLARVWTDHEAVARDHIDPHVKKERGGLSRYIRSPNRRPITGLSISDLGDRFAGGPEVNGHGLTHGIGFINGLGFTKPGTSEAKGGLSMMIRS